MKRINVLTISLLMLAHFPWSQLQAQEVRRSQVPSVILNRFEVEFRKARDVEWERKGSLYEVEFELGPWEHEVRYDLKGTKVYHSQEIDREQLPPSVVAAVLRKYPGARLSDLKRIQDKSMVTYRVEVKTMEGNERELTVDERGDIRSDRRD